MTDQNAPDAAAPRIGPIEVLAFVVELVAFAALAVWGFVAWPFPSNIAVGILAPGVAIALWALFLSPRAVLRVDPFVAALVHIVIMASAAYALFDLGQPIVAAVFAVAAIVAGVLGGRRRLS